MASRSGLGVVRFEWSPSRLQRQSRDVLGRFRSTQIQATEAHTRMALKVAQLTRDALNESIARKGRPQRTASGNGRLQRAIMSPKNRGAGYDGLFFFVESYMESSSAFQYWRNLEQGGEMQLRKPFSPQGKRQGEFSLHLRQLGNDPANSITIRIPDYAYVKKGTRAFYDKHIPRNEYRRAFGSLPGFRWISD